MTTCRSALLRPLLLAALCLLAAPPAPAQDLDVRLPSLMEKGNVPGLSIAVLRDGRLAWSGAFGVRSTETGERVDAQTVFEAASLSKPVFAYAVLRLAERGAFDLDTPLADILPYERLDHEPRYRQITARMVLSHSTGLPNWGGERLDLTFDPGTAWGYSGEGFVYLQKAVEHLTGLTLDALARREVFEPLGMTRSSYVWQDAFAGNAVARHSPQGEVEPIRQATEGNAAASLLTTAEDYARFLAAIVQSEGLRQETTDAMLTPVLSVVSSTWGRDRARWSQTGRASSSRPPYIAMTSPSRRMLSSGTGPRPRATFGPHSGPLRGSQAPPSTRSSGHACDAGPGWGAGSGSSGRPRTRHRWSIGTTWATRATISA